MAKGCPVCRDPRRDEIALALLRQGPKAVAKQFGLKLTAVSYHRRHIPREIARKREALVTSVENCDDQRSFRARLEKLLRMAERIVADARIERDWGAATGALREARNCVELLARLRGELHSGGGVQVGVAVNVAGGVHATGEELDRLIALRVSEATVGFNPEEIQRRSNSPRQALRNHHDPQAKDGHMDNDLHLSAVCHWKRPAVVLRKRPGLHWPNRLLQFP